MSQEYCNCNSVLASLNQVAHHQPCRSSDCELPNEYSRWGLCEEASAGHFHYRCQGMRLSFINRERDGNAF